MTMPSAGQANSSEATKLVAAAKGETLTSPPIWLMRQAGRYLPEYRDVRSRSKNFLDFCYSPELAIEATLQPVTRFGMDAAILFSDILVIPDALGQTVQFQQGEGPVLHALRGDDDLARLNMDRLSEHLQPVYTALGGVREKLDPTRALIGFAGAPWTIATYMIEGRGSRDHALSRLWAYQHPERMDRLIDLLVEAVSRHLVAQLEAGADIVQIFDSWAGVLPDSLLEKLCIEPTARIVGRVREARPDALIIGFPRGIGDRYPAYQEATGVNVVGLDTSVSVRGLGKALQVNGPVQGNLDPIALLAGGDALEREVMAILEVLGHGPFIFNLGHGILKETPIPHVTRLVEIVRAWRG